MSKPDLHGYSREALAHIGKNYYMHSNFGLLQMLLRKLGKRRLRLSV